MMDDLQLYDLVVVGSSAGGIEALSLLVGTLPADFPAPLVLAQHLDPDRPSHLAEILARRSTLPVRRVEEGSAEALEPGVVYVVPADRDVEISDHTVGLRERANGHPKPSVDLLLTSAARAYGERLIAVILTGSGSDGAAGAREVKAAGGMVIIENPETASFPGMPASLAPSSVDVAVDLDKIGPLLFDLLTGAYAPAAAGTADDLLPVLLDEVRARSGIDFGQYKRPTILRRLQRRLAATDMPALPDYLAYLHDHPEEYGRLAASFLIKVTEFFRDEQLFDDLRTRVIPEIVAHARTQGNQIRAWSAGCATGEEAYSLAILIAEHLGDELDRFSVHIFATDVAADALAFARRGTYPPAALTSVPEALRERYFLPADGGYTIVKRVRGLVIFGEHDLGQRAPFPNLDLVLCRNVLMYFTPELQQRALQLFAFALRDGGYLALGTAETTSPLADYFAPVHPSLKLFRRRGGRLLVPPVRAAAPRPAAPISGRPSLLPAAQARTREPSPASSTSPATSLSLPSSVTSTGLTLQASRELLGEHLLSLPVGVVVVDPSYDVQIINNAAYTLLGINRVAIGKDLLHLAHHVPTEPFRTAINAALQATPGTSSTIRLELAVPERRAIEVTCYPHERAGGQPGSSRQVDAVILLIADATGKQTEQGARVAGGAAEGDTTSSRSAVAGVRPAVGRTVTAPRRGSAARIQQLEHALAQALADARDLREANQELRGANEELRQDSESLLVRQAEVETAAEEVKTLNEEMQATNEELETLNEEMEATLEELHATNDDLQARTRELEDVAAQREQQRLASERERARLAAILASMSDALLVVDASGAPVFANLAYTQLFSTLNAEPDTASVLEDGEGRPLRVEATPQYRVREDMPFAMTCSLVSAGGTRRWLEARGEPIHTEEGFLGGVVAVRDVTESSLLRLQERFLAMVNHELRSPLTSLLGALQLLVRRLHPAEADDRLRQLGAIALQQVQLLRAMVDDLADLARAQHGKLHLQRQPIDVGALVQRIADSLNLVHGLGEGHADRRSPGQGQRTDEDEDDQRVRVHIIPDASQPVWIDGDPLRIEQIVNNLVINALTYAPESKRVDVTLRRGGSWAELRVEDYGRGIPAADLPHLFTPYYQAEQEKASVGHGGLGLGLGLFITAELVKAHGGTISVRSTEGSGTRFILRFPLSTDPTTVLDWEASAVTPDVLPRHGAHEQP